MHGAACSGPDWTTSKADTNVGISSAKIMPHEPDLFHLVQTASWTRTQHFNLRLTTSFHAIKTKPNMQHFYGSRVERRTASCSSPTRARRLAGVGDVLHLRAKVSTGSLTTCVRPIVEVCHRRAATYASLVGRLGEMVCNYVVAHRGRPFDTPGSAQDTAQTTCLFSPDQLNVRSTFRTTKMYREKEWNAANTIV
jgi:hypothetical protein